MIRRDARLVLAASLSAAVALSFAGSAGAQSAPTLNQAQIADEMHSYFRGEKAEAPFIFGAGLAGMGVGLGMVVKGGDIARGAGFPMMGLGLAQAIVGAGILLGTNGRVAKLDAALAKDPAAWKRDEEKRMAGVNTTLVALLVFESVLITGGVTTAVVASRKDCCRTLQGVGLGLAAEGAITMAIDIFESARAREYADRLSQFAPGSAGSSGSALRRAGGSAPMTFGPISFGGRF